MSDATLFGRAVIDRLTALEVSLFGGVANYSDITNFERAVLARIGALEVQKFGSVTVEPDVTSFTRAVLDRLTALEGAGTLGTLSLSATTFTRGVSASGTIIGATALSVVTASGLPSGLTINSGARTWAWDGSGSGSSNSSLTLTETLAGYSNTPHNTVISYSIIVGGSLATPTLTNSSALGAAPLVLSTSSADYTAGLYLQLQIDQTSNAFSNITQNLVFLVDGASWAALDEAIGLATPSGQYWSRVRVVRDNESGLTTVSGTDPSGASISFLADVSSWSTTFTDTIIASSAVLATTTGADKSSIIAISGTPALTFTGSASGGKHCARTTAVQASSKAQFEVTQVSGGASANFVVGLDDGTTNLNTDVAPGYSNSAGIAINIALGAYIIVDWNNSGSSFNFANNVAGTVQDGDTFTFEIDTANHTMDCWRTRSAVLTKIGGQATGLPTLSSYHAFAGSINTAVVGTMNFGGTTYTKTPGAGVAAFWA